MSIIYEALKKVEGSNISEPELKPLTVPKEKIKFPAAVKAKKNPLKKRDTFLGLAIACLGFIISFFLYNYLSKPPDPVRPSPIGLSKNDPAARAFDSTEYTLEGIVYDAGAPFAIINGKVVKTYDTIGAFIVKKIDQEEVEMVNADGSRRLILSLY